jgi:C-terminal processing protease CtpA/Prc
MSAGETLAQALMGRSSHVLRVGDATHGISGSVLQRHLPKGWVFGLPNTILFTFSGLNFDGRGIPPDMLAPVFKDDDIANKKDPAMDRAVKALTSG